MNSFNIRISEAQRRILQDACRTRLANTPDDAPDREELEALVDMFDLDGPNALQEGNYALNDFTM